MATHGGIAVDQVVLAPAERACPIRLAIRPELVVGRDDLLAEMRARLTAPGPSEPRIVALAGLAGIGKTCTAVEYAHRHKADYDVVWQVRAHDPAVLSADLAALARALGVLDPLEREDPIHAVHAVVGDYTRRWLIILDNAAARRQILAVLPPFGNCHVVVTTQDATWVDTERLDVPMLGVEDATGLLSPGAHMLAEELGGLPLAVRQARAYMAATAVTAAEYFRLFREFRDELMQQGQPDDYTGTVATTWHLAYEQLAGTDAAALLALICCFDPDAIPAARLLGFASELSRPLAEIPQRLVEMSRSPVRIGAAITELLRFSLVTHADGGTLSVHRLVQTSMLRQLDEPTRDSVRSAARALLEMALPADPRDPATWPEYERLTGHAFAALEQTSEGAARVLAYLRANGDYGTVLMNQAAWLRTVEEHRGPDHVDTLHARQLLSHAHLEAGDYAEALTLQTAASHGIAAALGPNHPDAADANAQLGLTLLHAGHPGRAVRLLRAAHQVQLLSRGADDRSTLGSASHLAQALAAINARGSATQVLEAALDACRRRYGDDDSETTALTTNLASMYRERGMLAEARAMFEHVLAIQRERYGAEHLLTAITMGNLAHALSDQGDDQAALTLEREVYRIRSRVLGEWHPATLTAMNNLAVTLGRLRAYEESRSLLEAAYHRYRTRFGLAYRTTLRTALALVRCLTDAGLTDRARVLRAEALRASEATYGPTDALTVRFREHGIDLRPDLRVGPNRRSRTPRPNRKGGT